MAIWQESETNISRSNSSSFWNRRLITAISAAAIAGGAIGISWPIERQKNDVPAGQEIVPDTYYLPTGVIIPAGEDYPQLQVANPIVELPPREYKGNPIEETYVIANFEGRLIRKKLTDVERDNPDAHPLQAKRGENPNELILREGQILKILVFPSK